MKISDTMEDHELDKLGITTAAARIIADYVCSFQ